MDDIESQLAARNRHMRWRWQQLTPAERLREMAKQQQLSWELLRSSPEGYAHFIRRNFKARAIDPPQFDSNGS